MSVCVCQSNSLWPHGLDCSPPGSFSHEIFQAKLLEWVVVSFFRGSSRPRDWTQASCIAGRFFTIWATREAQRPNNRMTQIRPKMIILSHNRLEGCRWSVVHRLWGAWPWHHPGAHVLSILLLRHLVRHFPHLYSQSSLPTTLSVFPPTEK